MSENKALHDVYFHMEYPKTTTINTAAIMNAIRSQKSYYRVDTIETDIVDPNASNCYACPYYRKDGICHIACEQKQYQKQQVRTYINERNRFGTRQELNAMAIKLFLYLHFLRTDAYGYVRVEASEAAEVLCCSKRTIVRNLEILSKRGYISYTKGPFTGTFQAFILSVSENKKTASQGGRGYFVLSYDMFTNLKTCRTVNELRLELRGIVSTLEGVTNHQFLQETSFSDAKRMLPNYATKKMIKGILFSDQFGQMFGTKLSKEGSFFYITIKDECNPVRLKTDICNQTRETLEKTVALLNDTIQKANKKLRTHDPLLTLSREDMNDIAKISLQLPIHVIESAIYRFYETYIKKGERIHKPGAMIRTLSWDIYNYEKLMT